MATSYLHPSRSLPLAVVVAFLGTLLSTSVPGSAAVVEDGDGSVQVVADVVFAVDESGSMGGDQDYLADEFKKFARDLAGSADARFGLVGYGSSDPSPRTVRDFTSDVDSLSAGFDELVTNGGVEPAYDALVHATQNVSGWRSNSSACAILLTDEPSNGDSATVDDAISALDSRSAAFTGVVHDPSDPGFSKLAADTDGYAVSINEFRDNRDAVMDEVRQNCVRGAAVHGDGADLGPGRNGGLNFGPGVQPGVEDPVNVVTGNFYRQRTDLEFPDTVSGLDVTRAYNSRGNLTSSMGPGWTPPGGAELFIFSDGSILLREPSGRQPLFTPADGGGYNRPDGIYATLAQTDDGYELAWDDGRTWTFNSNGLITTEENWDGQTVSYSHGDLGVARKEHSAGYAVDLDYETMTVNDTTRPRLVSAVADDGRTVEYSYTDAGYLHTVTDPTGATTTFAVDADGRVTAITDPDGVQTVTNVYDDANRVTEQTDHAGGTTTLAYESATTTVDDARTGDVTTFEHTDGNLTGITDPLGETASYTYDAEGNLTEVTDRRGATTTRTYDDRGNLVAATDEAGRTTEHDYDDANRRVRTVRPDSSTVTKSYDGDERLPSSVTGPEGGTTTFEVVDGLVHQTTDPDGVTHTSSWTPERTLVSTTDGDGAATSFEYDSAGRRIATEQPSGATTTRTLDAAGRVVEETAPDGGTTSRTYDASGDLVSETDPSGATTTWSYDAAGRVASTTDPNGETTTYTYDNASRPVAVEAPGGATTSYEYGALGRLVKTTDPEGVTTTYGYDVDGAIDSVTDGAGNTTTYTHDRLGRLASITDPEDNQTSYDYDQLDRVVEQTAPDGATTTYAYDDAGRLTAETDPRGAATGYAWTPAGRLDSITDPVDATTDYGYDAAGRLAAVTDPLGRTTSLGYDPDGNLASQTTPAGLTTRYTYDGQGRVTGYTGPDGQTTSLGYTPRGNLADVTHPDGSTRSFAYDPTGRLVEATDPNGGTVSYGYDARGNRVERTNQLGTTEQWSYDLADRMTAYTDALANTTTHSYDDAGRLKATTDPTGRRETLGYDGRDLVTSRTYGDDTTLTYQHDSRGRRTTMDDPTGVTSYSHDLAGNLTAVDGPTGAVGYTYDLAGRRTETTYPDGTTTSRTYDAAGQVTHTDGPIGTTALSYDADGRITEEDLPGDDHRRYTYGEAGRLQRFTEHVDDLDLDINLAYDVMGRLDRQATQDQVADYSYDPAGQLVDVALTNLRPPDQQTMPLPVEPASYAYDAAGNRVTARQPGRGLVRSTYDAADRLTSVEDRHGTTDHTYDAAGRLTGKDGPSSDSETRSYNARGLLTNLEQTTDGNTLTETRTYNGNNQLLTSTLDDGEATTTRYTWDAAAAVPQILAMNREGPEGAGEAVALIYGHRGRLGAVTDGSPATFATDPLGSTLDTDATDHLAAASSYTPFGVPTADEDDPADNAAFGFRGELATTTGLHLRARDYEPTTGTFTTPDPLDGLPSTTVETSRYQYAFNDPVQWTDPNGLSPVNDCLLATQACQPGHRFVPQVPSTPDPRPTYVQDFAVELLWEGGTEAGCQYLKTKTGVPRQMCTHTVDGARTGAEVDQTVREDKSVMGKVIEINQTINSSAAGALCGLGTGGNVVAAAGCSTGTDIVHEQVFQPFAEWSVKWECTNELEPEKVKQVRTWIKTFGRYTEC